MPWPSVVPGVASAEALELGVGVGVVEAEAIPVTPRPAPRARAPAEMASVILFVRDMCCLLDLPRGDGA